jgi:hypothetical protein
MPFEVQSLYGLEPFRLKAILLELKMKNTEEKNKVIDYLSLNKGKAFDSLNVLDESGGRWVQSTQLLNKHLVRHLKTSLPLDSSTGDIGSFIYHDVRCKKLLVAQDFFHNKSGSRCFWYAWN